MKCADGNSRIRKFRSFAVGVLCRLKMTMINAATEVDFLISEAKWQCFMPETIGMVTAIGGGPTVANRTL